MDSIPGSSPFPTPRASECGGRGRTLALAALAQAAGLAAAAAGTLAHDVAAGIRPAVAMVALAAGAVAALAGRALGLASWWRWINLALPPAVYGALALALDPAAYLAAFVAMLLVFGFTARSSVPLYLSGRPEIRELAALLPERPGASLFDAGCGIGSVLAGVRALRPDARVQGVESALLPWLVARQRARGCVGWGDFWRADFGRHDVVYAFLSPVAMPALWRKARAEMRSGSLLVSNRFIVPGVPPARTIATGMGRALYVWRM